MNDLEQIKLEATRDGFGEALIELGEKDENIVVLSADVSSSTRCDEFENKFPKRFFQIGIAEQNMAGVAAGLGVSGKIPFISSYAVFSPGRNWEQIRTTICYNDSNVKIAGHHAGFLTGADGATHQPLEDIALMRSLPNMKVIVPCDAIEAKKATLAAAKIWGPVYIRLAREKTPIMSGEEAEFVPGKSYVLWESKKPQVLIVGAGPVLHSALLAAKELDKDGVGTIVLNSHTIKPLDEETILKLAKKCGAVVSVEEHNVIGGLGSAVSEILAKKCPLPMEFVGANDVFGETGKMDELWKKYGLDAKSVKAAVKKIVKRK
jgi:transketolase